MEKLKFVLFFIGILYSVNTQSQSGLNSYWSNVNEAQVKVLDVRQIIPNKYVAHRLQMQEIMNILSHAPMERSTLIEKSNCIVSLPLPDGTFQDFKVLESPVMAPSLASSFPNIKTYSLKGIQDVYANGKLDVTEFGLHAIVLSNAGDFFIDPYCVGNSQDYISYYRKDFSKHAAHIIPEAAPLSTQTIKSSETTFQSGKAAAACVGGILKTYRLAIACTHQYAIAATGFTSPSVAQTLARVVTTINRVNAVYEKELAIKMELVPTTTLVLYTNSVSTSFTGNANSDANLLINQSQSIITASIGSANFDIGHTFSTGGGGLANLGCVCVNSQKARGITGSSNPVGDPYDIDYVAHEIGHQFGGNHTFNAVTGNCSGNRDGISAVEPGSGITIMAYAGICGFNNIANNSIPYFHALSFDEITAYTTSGSGASCAVTIITGNQPPVVVTTASYVVPKSTPFILNGSATDPDGDVLTYSWEEMDAGLTAGNWNSGAKPFFRSYAPVNNSDRLFPRASVIASGNYTNTIGEYLPKTAQTLNFRLTVRDNKMGGGGVCFGKTVVQVDSSGPLVVVYPSESNIAWAINSQKIITWNPNQTEQPPVNCDSVRILISYDGGNNYSVLVNSAPNFGWQQITVPNLSTTVNTCRIKIENMAGFFYDVSDNNFTISTDPFVGINSVAENKEIGLHVWPNPNSGTFSFAVSHLIEKTTTVEVIDILGRVLLQKTYSYQGEINDALDISHLGEGVYILCVKNGNNQSLQKVIKN